jgi:hypothetical protein
MVKIATICTAVQILWTNGEFPVEVPTRENNFERDTWKNGAGGQCARAFVGRFACLRQREA